MKKTTAILCGAILSLACASTFAASQAHYGLPHPLLGAKNGANDAIPLTVTNNTTSTYNVDMTQANGDEDDMPIQSVNNYPYNVISIDNPAWPVHVQIATQSGYVFYNNQVFPSNPNVKINPNAIAMTAGGVTHYPQVITTAVN